MDEFEEAAWRLCSCRTQQDAEVHCINRRSCSSECIMSCDAKMCRFAMCPHIPSMAHRDKYGCDLGTGEEEQVDPMLE